jgi:hypothetical protein
MSSSPRRNSPRKRTNQPEQPTNLDKNPVENDAEDSKQENQGIEIPKRGRGRPPGKKNRDKSVQVDHEDEDDVDDYFEEFLDLKGEDKIDIDGYLKGGTLTFSNTGRQYRFDVFTLPRHPTRLYLYSMDASKLLGSRDTYAFFVRNRDITKVIASEEDKDYLRFHNLLPSRYGGRTVSLIVVRNLFRAYGHRIIRKGKVWFDDYFSKGSQPKLVEETVETYIDKVEHMIFNEETLALGNLRGNDLNSEVMYRGIPILGFSQDVVEDDPFDPSFIPPEIADDGPMLRTALSAADYNRRFLHRRPTSFLDLHTNTPQVSQNTQPDRVMAQVALSQKMDFRYVADEIHIPNSTCEPSIVQWLTEEITTSKFPISIYPLQFKNSFSL